MKGGSVPFTDRCFCTAQLVCASIVFTTERRKMKKNQVCRLAVFLQCVISQNLRPEPVMQIGPVFCFVSNVS